MVDLPHFAAHDGRAGHGRQAVLERPAVVRQPAAAYRAERPPDGRVKAHHPSDRWDIHGYIEDYSCLWIQGLRTWHDNTGDLELVREAWPAVTAQLKWFLDRRTERGLVKAREFVFLRAIRSAIRCARGPR